MTASRLAGKAVGVAVLALASLGAADALGAAVAGPAATSSSRLHSPGGQRSPRSGTPSTHISPAQVTSTQGSVPLLSTLPRSSPRSGPQTTARVRPAVLSRRVIGTSVNGHPIRAWELGDRDAEITAVAIGTQHGNELPGQTVLTDLRDGEPVEGVHLWVVPRANPDGVLAGTRQNARGVDLNRNFPRHWKRITGYYDSGPRPGSEPETRTMMRFLKNIEPDLAVSFHTPLYGLDVSGAKDKQFARRLSKELRLPDKVLRCSGRCHGTLSQWFNHRLPGTLVTVEFGADPPTRYLHARAPRGLVRAFGGHSSNP